MAIDIIARGLATSLIGSDGRIDSSKLPTLSSPAGDGSSFTPVGALTDASWIQGRTAEEILLAMLFGLVNPVLIDPSFSIELLTDDVMVAGVESTIEGVLHFDRGEIRAADGSVLPRTGDVTQLIVANCAINSESFSIPFTPTLGDNVITASVEFAEGAQPVDSLGNPYGVPYSAGSMTTSTIVTGIYNITTATGDPIEFEYFKELDGEGYEAIAVTEAIGVKQSFQLPLEIPALGIKQFNTLSQQWEWIGGSKEASLATFDTEIAGNNIIYTHNGSIKGARTLRIYIILNEE